MSQTAGPAEVEHGAEADQQFFNPSTWWQPEFAQEQPITDFAAIAAPRYNSMAGACNDVAVNHTGYLPSGTYETGTSHQGHVYDTFQPTAQHHAIQYEVGLYSSFDPFATTHQFFSSNLGSGLISPTSSSRPSISSSSNSCSPTASDRYFNPNRFDIQGSPVALLQSMADVVPLSPAISNQSPTQSQQRRPTQVERLDEPYKHASKSEPAPGVPGDITFCYAERCNSRFTGEYHKGNLKRHIKSNHPQLLLQNGESPENPRNLTCKYCGQYFKRSDARKKHEYRTHGSGSPPLKKIGYAGS